MGTTSSLLLILNGFRQTGARTFRRGTLLLCLSGFGTLSSLRGAEVTDSMWREIVTANQQLRALVEAQQKELAELRDRVDRIDQAGGRQAAEVAALRDRVETAPPLETAQRTSAPGKVALSGEAGVAFFAGEANSHYNNAEFRVDEATLRLEAEAARNVYLFGELQLAKRETRDETFHLGEFYLEFADLGGDVTPDGLLSVRLGRVDVPFGEEYQRRDLLQNPLITHSISDVWGTDEGIELHGKHGSLSYALAVQNGNAATLRDFTRDKMVTARIGFDPVPALHLSASYLRTGDLDATRDFLSEIWIGNIAFRSIGSTATTRFNADIAEVDATWSWAGGHAWGAIGRAGYADNDPQADNGRDLDYYQLEIVQALGPHLYGAIRYSALDIDDGYPIAGIGAFGEYFFGPWTTKLRRLSLGGGYRFNPNLVFKVEYTLEDGRLRTGARRDNSNLFSAEAVAGF